jgi:hypothetical protein
VDARVTASAAAQHDQPVDASSCPSQLLTVKVLRRPVESALATLVRMEHHPRRGITGGDRVGQRVAGQLGAQMLGQGEADHPAGGDVDHGG